MREENQGAFSTCFQVRMATDTALDQLIVDQSRCQQANVQMPTYDRSQLKHGIVHLSMGNFHRSHLAYYMDRLASEHGQ